jgi:glucose-1-phosphatase
MGQRQPAIIFDFGNVVAYFDYQKACDRLGALLGQSGEGFRRRITNRGFADLARRFECGRLSADEFEREATVLCDLEVTRDQFRAAWQDIFWLNEPVAGLVGRLKSAGYTLILGSNTNVLHADHFRRQFAATLAHFDHLILSYEVGAMKPEAAFYQACVAAARRPAAMCLFVDDLDENVAGALRAGLSAVRYLDTATLIDDLRRLGVEVAPAQG